VASPLGLQLIITAGHERAKVTTLIATAALRGPLFIIAGSAWIPSYSVARLVRESTFEVERTLSRVRLARAFSCYQLLDLLASTRGDGTPILVLDFLHNFLNNDISLPVRLRTLQACCEQLRRLSLKQSVTVFTPQGVGEDYETFCPLLSVSADQILQPVVEEPFVWQPRLF
jgi:hypothetical protein